MVMDVILRQRYTTRIELYEQYRSLVNDWVWHTFSLLNDGRSTHLIILLSFSFDKTIKQLVMSWFDLIYVLSESSGNTITFIPESSLVYDLLTCFVYQIFTTPLF
ncbi:hypothetical protein Hanom_Chr01g00052501 [Helianthus anomalus]